MALIAHHADARPPIADRPTSDRSLPVRLARAIESGILALLEWQERARQRRELLALGDRALADIGRSRADAAAEGAKPRWRA